MNADERRWGVLWLTGLFFGQEVTKEAKMVQALFAASPYLFYWFCFL
jgi:hypothetical protein